jgi:hypothetical protein
MTIHRLGITCGFILGLVAIQAQNNDIRFTLHEETVNKVLAAVGPITGKSDYEALLMKGTYTWKMTNPQIHFYKDSSIFTCEANVKTGFIDYNTPVNGYVKIGYDQKTNKISIQITKAIFELYTKIFGKKIHLKNIDLAKYFKDPFLFDGPATMQTEFEFSVNDTTKKKIYVRPTVCDLVARKGELITSCEVEARDTPFIKPVQVQVKK